LPQPANPSTIKAADFAAFARLLAWQSCSKIFRLNHLRKKESNRIMERTLVLLKPDCVQRRLVGQVLSRFEAKGLNIIALKMLRVTPDLSKQHYAEHVQKPFYPNLEKFITASPIVAMVVEGLEAVRVVREMLGATSGLKAAPGTIRGDYSSSRQMNLVHASDGPEASAREIALYFRNDELHSYMATLTPWFRADDEN
jgi:nucleoside-diphosphate kinase